MKHLTTACIIPLLLLAGSGEARCDDRASRLYREHMALLDRFVPPTWPPVRSRPPERALSRTARPRPVVTPTPDVTRHSAPVRRVRHHASANAIGPRLSRGPMERFDGLRGDEQRYCTPAMSRQMSTVRPRVLSELIRIAGTLAPTGTTLLGAEALPGNPKSVTLGELQAFTRATGREAGIWWDPVRRKNTIALGNSQPTLVYGVMVRRTPAPHRSCFLIAHTHPADSSSSPSDPDFKALQTHQRRAVVALKGWPRHSGATSFSRFKSLLLPANGDAPVIFSVPRPDDR